MPVEGREVTVVHYGERNEPIVSHLEARGARVRELMLYEWRLPADVAPLSQAIDALIAGDIPVLAFTSQVQVRHLLEVAGPARREALLAALNATVLVGAVGPTCAAACTAAGIRAVVAPEHPKLAPLLQVLARAQSAREHARDRPRLTRLEGVPVTMKPTTGRSTRPADGPRAPCRARLRAALGVGRRACVRSAAGRAAEHPERPAARNRCRRRHRRKRRHKRRRRRRRGAAAAASGEPPERGAAVLAARACGAPRPHGGLRGRRIHQRPRRRLLPEPVPVQRHGAAERVVLVHGASSGRARRRQERGADWRAVSRRARSADGLCGHRQRQGARGHAGRTPGAGLRRSATGRSRQLAQYGAARSTGPA